MPAPVMIQLPTHFNGLGTSAAASAPARSEITYDQWVQQTNQQWFAANPDAGRALMGRLVGSHIAGLAALVAGGVAFFGFDQKAVGAVLGAAGVGLMVYGHIATQRELVGESILKVGSRPGISGFGMV